MLILPSLSDNSTDSNMLILVSHIESSPEDGPMFQLAIYSLHRSLDIMGFLFQATPRYFCLIDFARGIDRVSHLERVGRGQFD